MKRRSRKKTAEHRIRDLSTGNENVFISGSIPHYARLYLEHLEVKNYSQKTVDDKEKHILYFLEWCNERGIYQLQEISSKLLELYQKFLFRYRKKNGKALSVRSQYKRLNTLRLFFSYLAKKQHININPSQSLELPRLPSTLPKRILSTKEVQSIFSLPDLESDLGVRDRAILELFYATGIRRSELCNLDVYDMDLERELLFVRQGKGKKDRVLPIGESARFWLSHYLEKARVSLVKRGDVNALFVNYEGERFHPDRLSSMVSSYIKRAGIEKGGSCHLFRHTMATLMLENGADIRFIQQMLGHSQLTATQIYTQVSIKKLQEIHRATHPGKTEKL